MPSTRTILRTLFAVGGLLALAALAAPLAAPDGGSYTLTYGGAAFEATEIRDTAYFWGTFHGDEQATLQTARREGSTVVDRPYQFVTEKRDSEFSVVRNETVLQYRLEYEHDAALLRYRCETLAGGLALMVVVVAYGLWRRDGT